MTELVSEYLECLGLEYSKRVFDAESGAEELASRRDRAALARDMGVAPPREAKRRRCWRRRWARAREGEPKVSAPRRNLRLRLRLTAIKRPSPEISSSPTTRTARTSRRTSTSTTPTPGRRKSEARARNRLSRRRPQTNRLRRRNQSSSSSRRASRWHTCAVSHRHVSHRFRVFLFLSDSEVSYRRLVASRIGAKRRHPSCHILPTRAIVRAVVHRRLSRFVPSTALHDPLRVVDRARRV